MAWMLLFLGFLALFLSPPVGLVLLAGAYYTAMARKHREVAAEIYGDEKAANGWGVVAWLTVVFVVVVAVVVVAGG